MKKIRTIKSFALVLLFVLALAFSSCAIFETPKGISKTEINELGELVITYTDGSQENLGVIVGQDGKDGVDGKDGDYIAAEKDKVIEAASAKALTSSVSIYCGFERTVYGQPQAYASAGSGVIYKLDKTSGDAFVITNYHVVYDPNCNASNGISEEIYVYLYGSELESYAMKAEYVGGSLSYDIAVLRIENSDVIKNSGANPVSIFNSDEINVGESAIAIGNPEGMGFSTSLGIVSVDSEYINMLGADEQTAVNFRVMRIDTAVNSGNSGGGLFNQEGELIGIVNAKIQSEDVENIAYAIPSNLAKAVADNIIYYCLDTDVYQPQRPLMGITIQVTDSHAEYDSENERIKIVEKITIISVEPGSAAYGVFKEGDVLKSASFGAETYEITRMHSVDFMLNVRSGETVSFTVERNGVEKTLELTIQNSDLIPS